MGMEKRKGQATELLKESEEMAKRLPHWWDKLEGIYVPQFDLD